MYYLQCWSTSSPWTFSQNWKYTFCVPAALRIKGSQLPEMEGNIKDHLVEQPEYSCEKYKGPEKCGLCRNTDHSLSELWFSELWTVCSVVYHASWIPFLAHCVLHKLPHQHPIPFISSFQRQSKHYHYEGILRDLSSIIVWRVTVSSEVLL